MGPSGGPRRVQRGAAAEDFPRRCAAWATGQPSTITAHSRNQCVYDSLHDEGDGRQNRCNNAG